MGVFWAFIAMVGWGGGDFLIQRSARKFGDGVALFYITLFASLFLFPFVIHELPSLFLMDYRFWMLLGASIILLFASLFDFEALRQGKLSVVEPVYALEIPVTVALSSFFLGEWLTSLQGIFVVTLVTGIIFVSLESLHVLKNFRLEKGVFLAFGATVGMGIVNFLFGIGARHTSPLLINWFTSTFVAIAMAWYLTYARQWQNFRNDWKKQKNLIISVSLFDNMAWVAYSFSTLSIPIAIATGISESYIALAAILGLVWNGEKIMTHQKIGLVCVILSAIVLSTLS